MKKERKIDARVSKPTANRTNENGNVRVQNGTITEKVREEDEDEGDVVKKRWTTEKERAAAIVQSMLCAMDILYTIYCCIGFKHIAHMCVPFFGSYDSLDRFVWDIRCVRV